MCDHDPIKKEDIREGDIVEMYIDSEDFGCGFVSGPVMMYGRKLKIMGWEIVEGEDFKLIHRKPRVIPSKVNSIIAFQNNSTTGRWIKTSTIVWANPYSCAYLTPYEMQNLANQYPDWWEETMVRTEPANAKG